MKVLIVGVDDELAGRISTRFAGCELADRVPSEGDWDVIIHQPVIAGSAQDQLLEAGYGVWRALVDLSPKRYVQLSSLELLDAYGPGWEVHELWISRPTPEQLPLHLAELAAREITRDLPIEAIVLRLARLSTNSPGWEELHIDDAVDAIARAATLEEAPRFQTLHIVPGQGRYPLGRAGRAPFSFRAAHEAESRPPVAPVWPAEPGPIETPEDVSTLALFGAGGPLGALTAEVAADAGMTVHQIDRHKLTSEPTASPQSPGAPLALALPEPHRQLVGDVSRQDDVKAAMAGCDVAINLAVFRTDPATAFAVNLVGPYNILFAAHELGIRKVVLGGPAQNLQAHPLGYAEDSWVRSDVPPRTGARIYFLSQFLGQEAARILSFHWKLSCPILLMCMLTNPDLPSVAAPGQTFGISWRDAARAMVAAAQTTNLPTPAPSIDIMAPGPQGRWAPSVAGELLGWEPVDDLSHFWHRTTDEYEL